MAISTDASAAELGNTAVRSSSGGWKSARLIIFVEMAERFAYFGVSSNLITYLTGPLSQPTAAAAANVNVWIGTMSFLPLLWAFIADGCLGRFRTIIISSSLYILGLGSLSFSAMVPSDSEDSNQLKVTLFFCSLFLMAIGQSGYKPCAKVFGADQFDGNDLKERKAKSSYFNWLMFGSCISITTTRLVSTYIQENLSWSLGFGIQCVSMLLALFLFLLGTTSYRFTSERGGKKNPFARIGRVFMEAVKNRRQQDSDIANANETLLLLAQKSSEKFRFLDRAAISCELAEIEEAKSVLRLVPIWITCLVYAIVYAQSPTFFTKQGAKMDRSISAGLLVPAAALQCFINISIIVFIPVYDCLFVPIARSFTHIPSGITMLQRIGTGIVLSVIAMVVAALVETKRLQTARGDLTGPMSVWWLVPQYVLYGVADGFTMAGLQEFFYDQVPSELRSVGMAMNLSIYGAGNFLSSFMISVIDRLMSQSGQTSWFDNDLNKAHLDYFYWLLASLSFIGLAFYMWFAKSYVYIRSNT
ncbi:hypothetical protein Bca4012_056815 [Brassica carinata]|uniref:Uncharacterized protein n=1 Tax=Brassica carinata TaxID=52824 RepID=A0A8X8B3D2_BRACI|nr:hypothetical protein Bca52824_015647 [Brassica carinata]